MWLSYAHITDSQSMLISKCGAVPFNVNVSLFFNCVPYDIFLLQMNLPLLLIAVLSAFHGGSWAQQGKNADVSYIFFSNGVLFYISYLVNIC